MYAVIDTKGAQHVVRTGDRIRLNRHEGTLGESITFDRILMVADSDGNYKIGTPQVEGAKVTAKVVAHDRDAKIKVLKYKRRKNYRLTKGHRQPYTELEIASIEL